jgi:hypothetical protein
VDELTACAIMYSPGEQSPHVDAGIKTRKKPGRDEPAGLYKKTEIAGKSFDFAVAVKRPDMR